MKISTRDEFLLDRWHRRLPNAAAEFLDEYSKPLYGFLLAVFGGAEKPAQEHFFRAFAAVFRSTHLTGMETPVMLDLLRCAVKEVRLSQNQTFEVPVTRRFSSDEDIQIRLLLSLRILVKMKLEDRLLILLRDLAELDAAEISFVMHIPADQLKNRLTVARIHFRESMNETLLSRKFHDLR